MHRTFGCMEASMADLKPMSTGAIDLNRLERLGAEFDSWNALLESEGRVSGATAADIQQRKKRLTALQIRYDRLRLSASETPSLDHSLASELPQLGLCTEDERELCEQYLDARLKILSHMRENLAKVMTWVDQAASLQKAGWRVKWRLSRIRRYVNQLELERQRLEPHLMLQNHNWKKIADCLLFYRAPYAEASNRRFAFESIIRLSHRIDQLQKHVQHLQGKTNRMEQWLKQAARRLQSLKPGEPPLADDMRLITQKIDQIGFEDLRRSRSRLAVARRYLEAYLITPDAEEETR
jgi:chromosome segregation ATPase